jgi:hypothetical protein
VDVLLQHARPEYQRLLDLSRARHKQYAEEHGFLYQAYQGAYWDGWSGHWDGWLFCLQMLKLDVEWLCWVDADALIVGDADLREALAPGKWLGLARHPGPPEHWNVGVMVIRNCPRVIGLFEAVVAAGPGEWPWYQQQILNELLEEGEWDDLVGRIEDRWNCTYGVTDVEDAQIRAWHGQPLDEKVRRMQAALGPGADVSELYLSGAVTDLLRQEGLKTLGDVVRAGENGLRRIQGIGPLMARMALERAMAQVRQ